MLRILTFVIVVGLLAVGAVWLADRPGAVSVDWLGWRLETSMPVLLGLLTVAAVGLTVALRLLAGLTALPRRFFVFRRDQRRSRGYQALSDGLAAAAGGDAAAAKKLADRARRFLADPSLTTFLSAQAAKLSGDTDAARDHYVAMLERPETASLGLRGLLSQALERQDLPAAIDLAGRARLLSPGDPWLAETLFALLLKTGNVAEAQQLADDAVKRRAWRSEVGAHRRAVVLTLRAATAAAEGDSRTALSLAKQAVKADPALSTAAVLLARQQAASNSSRRAAATLEKAWSLRPSPDLAQAYAELRPGEEPLDRLRRMEKLAACNPAHPEAHLIVAEAALAAKVWGQARKHLLILAESHPSVRGYRLLARLEQGEYNNAKAAQAWLDKLPDAPPDPAWQCGSCGTPASEWSALCHHCGAADGLIWEQPQSLSQLALPVAV